MTDMKVVGSTITSDEQRIIQRRTVQVILYPNIPNLLVDGKQHAQTFSLGDIAGDFNPKFTILLDDLRKIVQNHAVDGVDLRGYDLSKWWESLMTLGQMAYNKMLDKEARQHLNKMEKDEWDLHRRGLRITFMTPAEYSLFWEMLCNSSQLELDKKQFWGFRYPLGRAFWNTELFSDRIDIHEGVLSAIHHLLPDSQREVEQLIVQLEQASNQIGRKLSLLLLDKALTSTNDVKREEILEFFHSKERFRYGIVHFACHCTSPEEGGASQAFLCLTVGTTRIELPLDWLISKQAYGFPIQPLVFLNACESATPTANFQTISFPTGMSDFNAGGVVATACVMPDKFAAAFSHEFYKRLLRLEKQQIDVKGQATASIPVASQSNIAEALLQTRLYFLDMYDNPLGLAYGFYAISDQQLNLGKRSIEDQ